MHHRMPLIVVTVSCSQIECFIVYVIVLDCSLYSLPLLLSPCLDFLFHFVVLSFSFLSSSCSLHSESLLSSGQSHLVLVNLPLLV